jgi:MSHA biogenesis protein MshI
VLTKVNDFLGSAVYRNLSDWYARLFPNQNMLFSPDRCCISFLPGKIFFSHLRRVEEKADILLCEIFEYKELEDINSILAKVVQKYNLMGVRCTWILQPEDYQLLQTEALPVAPSEFQAAIRWKVKDLLRFPLEDAVIDSFAIPPAKLATSINMIMLVVSRASVLKPFSDQILASGLKLSTIDIPELAFRNLTAFYEKDEKSTAFLYLQEESSQLIVTQQKKLFFTRRLDFGLNAIPDLAADSKDASSMSPFIDRISLDLQRSFDYFQSQWRQPEPVRIFIGQSGPCKLDLAGLLAARLNVSVQAIDLSQYFNNKLNLKLDEDGAFLPLLGGILREWNESHAPGN